MPRHIQRMPRRKEATPAKHNAPKAPITSNAASDKKRPMTKEEIVNFLLNAAADMRVEANSATTDHITSAGHLFGSALALELAAEEVARAVPLERPPMRPGPAPTMLTLLQASERLGATWQEVRDAVQEADLKPVATFIVRDHTGVLFDGAPLYSPDEIDQMHDLIKRHRRRVGD